ncbi:Synaptotagmin-6 [Tupaia chinensis]|uniref:Synaptotagmin-6 n=1 Tax=Tupaia chinensis TaxID=246437 RepID=L9KS18_TUPCH|nr:Synaptotagmin-6 [Tupaia chinensis]
MPKQNGKEQDQNLIQTERQYRRRKILLRSSIVIVTFYTQESVDLGEIMFSLCYLPTAGRLTLTVIKCRNLKAMDITGYSDPYVKVSLLCDGRRLKKKKTTIKKNTLNPVYNEAIIFDIPPENMDQVSLLISVMDYDRVGHNEIIGVCRVGINAEGLGRDHWNEMLAYPRKPIAHWHSLVEVKKSFKENSKCPEAQASRCLLLGRTVSALRLKPGSHFAVAAAWLEITTEQIPPVNEVLAIAGAGSLASSGKAELPALTARARARLRNHLRRHEPHGRATPTGLSNAPFALVPPSTRSVVQSQRPPQPSVTPES